MLYSAKISVPSGTLYHPPYIIDIEFDNGGSHEAAIARGLILAEARNGELISCDKVEE